jgi:hypothetical protein
MVRGALRGAAATVLMTGVYACRAQIPMPPQVVSQRTRIRPWWAMHLAIGMTLGAIHDRSPIRGAPFGLAVWAASYATALPALGLYPKVDEDDRARAAAGVAAHAVFGAVL